MDLKTINKEKIREFIRTSPILFSLGFTLLALSVSAGFAHLNSLLLPQNTWGGILEEVVSILWPVALAVLFGFGFIFRQRGIRATFGAAWLIFLFYGFLLFFQVGAKISDPATPWKSELEIFQGILLLLGIGIREEVLFRGVITNAIARKYGSTTKGLWITALSTGAIFGAMHLSNVFYGVSFAGALTQAVGCIAGGVLYCAIYLRGGSIWVVALLHSLKDTPALLETYFTNFANNATAAEVDMMSSYRPDLTNVIVFVVQVLLAAFLLRKSKQKKIFDRIEQLKSSEMA
jgi:membrane protease YdiL (CAAX protease family)